MRVIKYRKTFIQVGVVLSIAFLAHLYFGHVQTSKFHYLVQEYYNPKKMIQKLLGFDDNRSDVFISPSKLKIIIHPGYSGVWREWYRNGELKSEVNYIDGLREGLYKGWYDTGENKSKGNYLNGKLHGSLLVWFNNGKKKRESLWVNGDFIGDEKEWYVNGSVKSIRSKSSKYKKLSWYENGKKNSELYELNNGKSVESFWYKNGVKRTEVHYYKGKRHGKWTRWYENGNLNWVSFYENGKQNGLEVQWLKNGTKEHEFRYKDDRKVVEQK